MLIPVVEQSDSVVHTYICILLKILFSERCSMDIYCCL